MTFKRHLLATVSYPAMSLLSLMEEERNFLNSKEYLDMKTAMEKRRLMDVIFQTMRTGKRLPMFAPHHRIQPPQPEPVAE